MTQYGPEFFRKFSNIITEAEQPGNNAMSYANALLSIASNYNNEGEQADAIDIKAVADAFKSGMDQGKSELQMLDTVIRDDVVTRLEDFYDLDTSFLYV